MLEGLSATQLAKKLSAGELSSAELCQHYLERTERYDAALGAVIELNPEALELAAQLDAERAAGEVRSAIHGLPIMVKDNFDTADQMTTTAGSLALEGHIAQADAFVIKKLREAGAVLLGKTNMSEWANFRSGKSSSGWSSRGGQVHNPHDVSRSPCGSSSGSGVAVSAELCAVALGTETDGSIVCPSAMNGVVGLKPTLGLLSRSGIIPIAHSQDTAGPMTRTVADAALLLGLLCGADKNDPVTERGASRAKTDYTQYLDKKALHGARLGVVRNLTGYNDMLDEVFEARLEDLRELGADLIDVTIDNEGMREAEYTVMLHEFKHDLNAYLGKLPAKYPQTLEALIEYNETHADRLMPHFKQGHFERALSAGKLSDKLYQQALYDAKQLSGEKGIDRAMSEHTLNALIAPTAAPAWPIDPINGDNYRGSSSSLAAIAGYPNITVPMGFVHGLPVGISFFAGAFEEPSILAYAYAFEQATKAYQAPNLEQL